MINFRTPAKLIPIEAGAMRTLVLLILGAGLLAQAGGQSPRRKSTATALNTPTHGRVIRIKESRALIPDIIVVNQEGQKLRLYSDLIKGKVVLLSFFFTGCGYTCPMQSDIFSRMQSILGPRLGKDIFLLSISMDPERDTPQKLRQWASNFNVKPGWTLVSSGSAGMKKMIEDFTGNKPGPREVHTAFVFIGNDRTEQWVSADGLTTPEYLTDLLDQMTGRVSANTGTAPE
jgi:cytochrome oxidase Cu insertion factor (SCO1/SenC/PrrC family)